MSRGSGLFCFLLNFCRLHAVEGGRGGGGSSYGYYFISRGGEALLNLSSSLADVRPAAFEWRLVQTISAGVFKVKWKEISGVEVKGVSRSQVVSHLRPNILFSQQL